jgi:hypothetical protein
MLSRNRHVGASASSLAPALLSAPRVGFAFDIFDHRLTYVRSQTTAEDGPKTVFLFSRGTHADIQYANLPPASVSVRLGTSSQVNADAYHPAVDAVLASWSGNRGNLSALDADGASVARSSQMGA